MLIHDLLKGKSDKWLRLVDGGTAARRFGLHPLSWENIGGGADKGENVSWNQLNLDVANLLMAGTLTAIVVIAYLSLDPDRVQMHSNRIPLSNNSLRQFQRYLLGLIDLTDKSPGAGRFSFF